MDYRDPDWVAQTLGLEKNTVYKFLQDGTIPAVQLGRKWLISETRLRQWLEQETERQTVERREGAASADRTVRRMDNFSPNARTIIRAAHTEARGYRHHYLGQEHLLLGFAAAGQSAAARVLAALGVTPDDLRRRVEQRIQPGDAEPPRRLGRTPRAKKAMRLAAREAGRDASPLVRSEHLLLGLLLAGEGLGFDILTECRITPDAVRTQLNKAKESP